MMLQQQRQLSSSWWWHSRTNLWEPSWKNGEIDCKTKVTFSCWSCIVCSCSEFVSQSMFLALLFLKIDYCDTIFYPLPDFFLKRLQRLQFAAGSFVIGRYIRDTNNIVQLVWRPIKERRYFHLLKLVYKLWIFSYGHPTLLLFVTYALILLNVLLFLEKKNTFQDSSAKLFNNLPIHIRNSQNFNYFCRETSTYLRNRISINKWLQYFSYYRFPIYHTYSSDLRKQF